MTAPIDSLSAAGGTALSDINVFVTDPNMNVLYKAFALVAVLIVLSMIPQTSKFAGWAAWLVLLVLLVQKN